MGRVACCCQCCADARHGRFSTCWRRPADVSMLECRCGAGCAAGGGEGALRAAGGGQAAVLAVSGAGHRPTCLPVSFDQAACFASVSLGQPAALATVGGQVSGIVSHLEAVRLVPAAVLWHAPAKLSPVHYEGRAQGILTVSSTALHSCIPAAVLLLKSEHRIDAVTGRCLERTDHRCLLIPAGTRTTSWAWRRCGCRCGRLGRRCRRRRSATACCPPSCPCATR